jgi:hypothetical protein
MAARRKGHSGSELRCGMVSSARGAPDRFSAVGTAARAERSTRPPGARRPCFSPPPSFAAGLRLVPPFPLVRIPLLAWMHLSIVSFCRIFFPFIFLYGHSNPSSSSRIHLQRGGLLAAADFPSFFSECQVLPCSVQLLCTQDPREAFAAEAPGKRWHLMEDPLASGSCTETSTHPRCSLAPRLRLSLSSSRSGSSCSTSDRTATQP